MRRLNTSVLIFCFLLGCSFEDDNIAKDKIYHFSVSSQSATASELTAYLIENMDNKRVAITNRSGQAWPYYEIIEEDKKVLIDSLMPPHKVVHRLKAKSGQAIKNGEYYLDIKVMIIPDTLPNYELYIYKMDSMELKLSAQTGVHFIENQPSSELYEFFLKSLVRYSFK